MATGLSDPQNGHVSGTENRTHESEHHNMIKFTIQAKEDPVLEKDLLDRLGSGILPKIVKQLYEKYGLRVLGVGKSLTFFMEVAVDDFALVVEHQEELKEVLGELFSLDARSSVPWGGVEECGAALSEELDLELGIESPQRSSEASEDLQPDRQATHQTDNCASRKESPEGDRGDGFPDKPSLHGDVQAKPSPAALADQHRRGASSRHQCVALHLNLSFGDNPAYSKMFEDVPADEEATDSIGGQTMPFPKPTLKGLFGKKEKRSGMKDQSKKDDKGDHLGTEMKGSGESLPGSLETSEDAESPVTGYGDGNLPSLYASQVGTKVSPSLTQPVRPPRGTDTKLPYTVLGQVNAGQLHHASMSSGYETDDNPSSVASDMPSSCDGAGDSQERPAEGGGREDGPPRASTCKPAAASSRTPSFSSFPAHSSGMSCVSFATEDGELFPESALNTPIGVLRKSRARLCLYLNIPQDPVESDLPPDYTGLAELLDFEAVEIQNFWERNPSDDLFREWVRCEEKQPFLWNLVYLLKKLGRQDILEECQGLILEDVADYIAEQALLKIYAVNRLHNFDCYVNIADQDLTTYGREILDTLEGVYRLRLCLTLRDVNVGGWQFDEMAKMLEERCQGKVLIVMSKYYEDSDACQFLTQFAVTLDPGARMNKLIPLLVDEGVFIPRVLRCLAILNYHRDKRLGFLWPRLKTAIKND